jgi:REP element-mobilizing transposase RayT
MGRPRRITAGDIVYHVLNRANRRARIFHKPRDYEAFLRILAQGLERTPCRVLGLCLMPSKIQGASHECHSLKHFRPLFQAFSKLGAWQGHVVVSFSAVLYYSRLVAISYGIHNQRGDRFAGRGP